jgi:hypothetical protein
MYKDISIYHVCRVRKRGLGMRRMSLLFARETQMFEINLLLHNNSDTQSTLDYTSMHQHKIVFSLDFATLQNVKRAPLRACQHSRSISKRDDSDGNYLRETVALDALRLVKNKNEN